MRASRLLSVLLLLQNRGRMTADALSAELEVSVRTIYRDIDALSAAGVPVYAERGRAGGYQLVGGYRTRLTGLTEQEALALPLAGLPDAAAELGLGAVLAAAQLKLHTALPPELRSRADTVAERFHLDVPGWHRGLESPPHLAAIAQAVWQCARVDVRYRRWDGSDVTRTLEPLGLVLKAGSWYLAARCAGTDRTYRVARMLTVTDTGEHFDRPAGFQLATYWAEWSRGFRQRLYPRIATVRMSPLAVRLAPFYLGSVAVDALGEALPEPDGWSRVRLPVEDGKAALGELLRFGGELEVLEPKRLREQVAEEARNAAARYG